MAAVLRRAAAPAASGVHSCLRAAQSSNGGRQPSRHRCVAHSSFSSNPSSAFSQRRSFASAGRADESDPYKLLGVERNAPPDEIKKAYRKEALKWHPDKNPENRKEAEKRFGAVANAYETLSDPEKKRQFDLGGAQSGGFHGGHPGGFQGGFQRGGFQSQADAERLFRDVFGAQSMDEVFGQLFGGRQAARGGPKTLQVGMDAQVLSEAGAVLAACRRSGIDSANDGLRIRSLGKNGRIIKVDPKDQSVKVTIDGVGDVWFGANAVRPLGGSGARTASPFSGFGNLGGFGGSDVFGGGVVQMKQEVVTLPDGRRVVRVTRVQRGPDGSLREEISEAPIQ